MSDQIFLIHEDRRLIEMSEAPYKAEDVLQSLLEDYPALLAGSQIDREQPRRWLLIAREISVPGDESLAARWSLDHLFVDQDAIPTLVEVKRSSDTRIRREVVGQMLDYAANSISYWSTETIRDAYLASRSGAADADEELRKFISSLDIDEFWKRVESNLKAGRMRMLFVADHIPRELQRIIEFLNEQMKEAEVLGVEIKQYTGPDSGSGMKTIVPRVIGQTAAAQQTKSGSPRTERQWDEESFFAELERVHPDSVVVARKLADWAHTHAERVWFGKGAQQGSLVPVYKDRVLFSMWTYATIEIPFFWYSYRAPFDKEEMRRDFMSRLNKISGVHFTDAQLMKRPGIKMTLLRDQEDLRLYSEAFEWFIAQVDASAG
jgi:hypothetical protein